MINSKFHIISLSLISTAMLCLSCNNADTQQANTVNRPPNSTKKITHTKEITTSTAKASSEDCCSEPGQAQECWNDDKILDNVISCDDDNDCISGSCDIATHLCTCITNNDCENNAACSDSGLCGPSWCNGYMICGCWGGCDWWHSDANYTPEDWAAAKGLYCCEGDYPAGVSISGEMVSGYLSNNPLCARSCTKDSDCDYLDNECIEGLCDAGGTCVPDYLSAGTNCGNDYPLLDCRNHDICDGSGNCVLDYVNSGTPCANIDGAFNTTNSGTAPYYPPSCYTGYCGAVTVDLSNFTNSFSTDSNGRCEPGVSIAENDTCNTLLSGGTIDTSNVGYLGTFDASASAFTGGDTAACLASNGCLTTSASLLCAQSNYSAAGDDCDSAGSGNPDLAYAFRYQTNPIDQQELYGYVIQVEADFNAAVYVINDADDCPSTEAVNSNRCLQSYAGNTNPWEIQVNTLGNSVPAYDQGCCNPTTDGTDCGYKWCTRCSWSYPSDPVPCRDDNLDGTTNCTTYTSYPEGNMASTVVYPLGLNADTSAQEYKNVLVFVDSVDGTTGNFTLTIERRKWDAGPIERINDDPRAYDVTDVDTSGSIYLGNFKNSVNSRHKKTASETCGGFDCSASWEKTIYHTGTANQYWPNTEYFKIHLQNDNDPSTHYTQQYCIYADEIINNSAGDLVINLISRNTNGSNKTISPIFTSASGPPYKEVACDFDTKDGDPQIEFTATEDVLYLIGISQKTQGATDVCTGNCNYKLTVKRGACSKPPDPPTCSNNMISMPSKMAGGFVIGNSNSPGYLKSSGKITQADGDSLHHSGAQDNSNDDTWRLDHGSFSFPNLTILVVDPPGGEDWMPWFELYGCDEIFGAETPSRGGTVSEYESYFNTRSVPSSIIPTPYPGQKWAAVTLPFDDPSGSVDLYWMTYWPLLAGIECDQDNNPDKSLDYEYEIYAIWW